MEDVEGASINRRWLDSIHSQDMNFHVTQQAGNFLFAEYLLACHEVMESGGWDGMGKHECQ